MSHTIEKRFIDGEVVLKITQKYDFHEKDYGMVITYQDYEKLLAKQKYNPLLFAVGLRKRIAYLNKCFNKKYRKPRSRTFKFYWREIDTNEWYHWFSLNPYLEDPENGCELN